MCIRKTAEIINETVKCNIIFEDSLKERGYGIFEGMIRKEINDELINSDILNNYYINKEYKEIESKQIGEVVMEHLKTLEQVAYVRFASVYREFKDVGTFMNELKKMLDSGENIQK